jgi:nucleotide-binding universal stress UspA family protein
MSGAILVAHDGSEHAHRAIDTVARLFPDRPAVVLSVWESATTLAPPHALATPAGADAYARVDKAAEEVAESIAEAGAERLRDAGLEASAATIGSHGGIAGMIIDYAVQEDVAVVAVGTRGRSRIRSMLLGSVANGLVQNCPKPVLVIRGTED